MSENRSLLIAIANHTEDDTFRVLSRKPLCEIYDEIINQIGLNSSVIANDLIIRSHGYTTQEFIKYDELYCKSQIDLLHK